MLFVARREACDDDTRYCDDVFFAFVYSFDESI